MATEAETDQGLTDRRTAMTVILLGLTQIVGWGTVFTPLAVIGTELGRDLGIAREGIFGGITVMLLVSALLAPRVGRNLDRMGARSVMVTGSLVAALAMVAMSLSRGIVGYVLTWVLAGIAMPMMLSNSALPGLVQVVGANARRAITGLMLINGLSSTVFMPATAYLNDAFGWRTTYLVFAALHVVVCVPIHALILARRATSFAPSSGGSRSTTASMMDGVLPADQRRKAFILLALWSCAEGLITWGLYMQVIDVLKAEGLTRDTAIWVWTVVGPAQAIARFAELVFGARHSIFATALASAALTTLSFVFVLPFGVSLVTAIAFASCLGIGHGLFAVARNTLPLTLFGAREYGGYMGWLMVPQNIVNAAAPIIFATVISRFSPAGALWIAGGAALAGCVAVVLLVTACRGPRSGGDGH